MGSFGLKRSRGRISQDKHGITATCPTGKTLVGGGARSSNQAAWVTTSGPGTVASGAATTWVADAEEVGSLGPAPSGR